jgi:hypothetical protein
MKKLEKEALLADRAAVQTMLAALDQNDPVGRLTFESRLDEINAQLVALDHTFETIGSVALMFGGSPVYGSRSISADFAGEALKTFQDLIIKRVATEEFGPLGERGPVRRHRESNLALREIVRGSVGFLLEEHGENQELADTATKKAIEDVTEVITRTASENIDDFETAVETLDSRLLLSLRAFFRNLDESNATVRIVEGDRDAKFDAVAIRRARDRVEMTEIEERESNNVVGELLGLLPHQRRFEMRLTETNEVVRGPVAADCAAEYLELVEAPDQNVVGRTWRARMKLRVIRERNKEPRTLYTLIGLLEQIG